MFNKKKLIFKSLSIKIAEKIFLSKSLKKMGEEKVLGKNKLEKFLVVNDRLPSDWSRK